MLRPVLSRLPILGGWLDMEFIIDWFIVGAVLFAIALVVLRNLAAAFTAAFVLGLVVTAVLHVLPESIVKQLRGGRPSYQDSFR